MKTPPGFWISLRAKIILPYLILVVLLSLGAAFVVTRITFDSIEERFVNQLIEAGKLASEWMVREEKNLLETERLLAHMDGIATVLQNQDAEKLRELVYPIAVNAGKESIEILDAHGVALLSLHRREGGKLEDYEFLRDDSSLQDAPLVRRVIENQSDTLGDKHADLVRRARGNYFYVAGPIFDERNQLVGILLVGETLDTLARQMRLATLAQVTLYDPDGQPLATTFFQAQPLNRVQAVRALAQPTSSTLRDLVVSDIEQSEIVGPWTARLAQQPGLVGVAFAKNFLVRISQNTWLQILSAFLLALLVVLILGLVISRRISQPIEKLHHAAQLVSAGDLRVRIEIPGNDEVAQLSQQFNQMVSNLYASQNELMRTYDATLEGWVKALDLRDHETETHSQRVTEITLRLWRALGMSEEQLQFIRRGALLHDIGKMAIPDDILLKPDKLNVTELELMHKHPTFAIEMLEPIPFLRPSLAIPASHHECWDGTGYPRGLQGEEIPIAARIFAVADVWDSLINDRPYRKAFSVEQATRMIVEGKGKHFEPRIVDTFLALLQANRV